MASLADLDALHMFNLYALTPTPSYPASHSLKLLVCYSHF